MKFFRLIKQGVAVAPLLTEVRAHEEAWLANTSRQDRIPVQQHTNTIFLRSAVRRSDLNINENQESITTKIAEDFPIAIKFLRDFASVMNCSLSRASIVRLKPKSHVGIHIDVGSYYLIRNRYHFVLRSRSGSILRSGNEQVRMREGELWWFDNKQYHCSFNESDDWRIHYIFDLLPTAYADLAVNPLPISVSDRGGVPLVGANDGSWTPDI